MLKYFAKMEVIPRTIIVSSKLSITKFDFYSFLENQKIERIILQCDYRILDYSKLPNCVYYIECDIGCGSIDTSILPSSITHLSISNPVNCRAFDINKLPSNLKYLSIGFEIYNNGWKDLLNLPPSLEELILYGRFNLPCYNLPHGLKKLIIKSTNFRLPLDNLPVSLEHLEIHNESSEFNSIIFPENLITLIIKRKKNITNGNGKITLSKLPRTIKYLTLDSNSYSDIEIEEFPEGLEILDITTNLHNLAMDILPKLPNSLKAIKLGRGKNENYNYITNKYPNISVC